VRLLAASVKGWIRGVTGTGTIQTTWQRPVPTYLPMQSFPLFRSQFTPTAMDELPRSVVSTNPHTAQPNYTHTSCAPSSRLPHPSTYHVLFTPWSLYHGASVAASAHSINHHPIAMLRSDALCFTSDTQLVDTVL
jgi:hypothetical protein